MKIEHYKPSKNAWKGFAIAVLVIAIAAATVATVWIAHGGVLRLGSSFQLELKTQPDIIITAPKPSNKWRT